MGCGNKYWGALSVLGSGMGKQDAGEFRLYAPGRKSCDPIQVGRCFVMMKEWADMSS